jgi:hypothetical protein
LFYYYFCLCCSSDTKSKLIFQGNGHITIQICLHGEPIKNSPLTVQVGEKQKYAARQTAVPTPKPQPQSQPQQQHYQQPQQQARPSQQPSRQQDNYPSGLDDILDSYTSNSQHQTNNNVEVTTDDLNALLDELGGY